MRLGSPSIAVLAALMLSACGGAQVRLSYPQPQTPEDAALAKSLSQVYLAVSGPADGLREFAAALDGALAPRGGAVLAYRVVSDGEDPFPAALSPSAVMRVSLQPVSVTKTDSEREVKSKDSDGKETVRKVPYIKRAARLVVRFSLSGHPDGAPLLERSASSSVSDDKPRSESSRLNDAAWLRKNSAKLLREAGKAVGGALPPARFVQRVRPVFVDEADPDSKAARSQAAKGAWEEASALWAKRLDEGRGGWRDLWNLSLAAETRRAFPEAQRLYAKSREAAGADPEAAKLGFDQVLADLASGAALLGRSEAASAWFARPTAVLPFSDDTTSVEGPENLRRLTEKALSDGGWSFVPSDDVDAALRRKGFSQGGQLHKTTPERLALWTGAERLLFANIAEFRNIMLGAFGKRQVSGTLRLWDAATRADSYKAEENVETTEAAAGGQDAAERLSNQLGKAFIENLRHKPLAEESAAWVERILKGLPLRPPPRR